MTLLTRGMKYLVAAILLLGAVMLYLMAAHRMVVGINSLLLLVLVHHLKNPAIGGLGTALLFFGVAVVLGLMVLVGYQLLALRRRLAAGLFGSKLTLRLVLLFSLVAVLPGALVYSVSVQFLNKSIESWFDVRVDTALEGGLSLARTILDNMLKDLTLKAGGMTQALADATPSQQIGVLNSLREQMAVQEATLFHPDGTIIAFSISEGSGLMPHMISSTIARKVLLQQPHRAVESDPVKGLRLRVVVPVNKFSGETGLLQLVQSVPPQLARDAEMVQSMYQDYQELSLSRQGLKRLYGLSLTLALLSPFRRSRLPSCSASGCRPAVGPGSRDRAVAQGISASAIGPQPDELGILTESFNTRPRSWRRRARSSCATRTSWRQPRATSKAFWPSSPPACSPLTASAACVRPTRAPNRSWACSWSRSPA
jgi:nitrogen fixation/metabolism regulation signal transduction histidine kinase